MDATAWDFRYGTGISGHPAAVAGGGFAFDFPTSGDVDYLTTNVSIAAMTKAHAVAKVETVSGTPMFTATDGCSPAAFRIMLEVRGDDMRSEYGRWWAWMNGPPLTAPGTYVMDVSIADLSQWQSITGGNYASLHPNEFRNAMANLGAVGITFGACSFGHGVSVSGGTARMTVTAFSVN